MQPGQFEILGPDGRPFQNNLEDPRLDLHDPKTWEGVLRGITTAAGVNVSPHSALGYPPLWRALNLISGDVGRLPLVRYRRMKDGGKETDRTGPSYRLLRRRANSLIRASAFKRTITYHALFRGNGFATILRNQAGIPVEMLILDPDETVAAVVEGELFYMTTVNGEQRKLRPENVFHIKGLSHDGLWGIDVFELMREAYGLPIAARTFMARFYGSGSNQSGVLMVPASFTDEKISNTLRNWNDIATGLAKSHKVALLKENVKFVPTSVKPGDSDTTGILDHEVRTVSAITGCPPHKLGDVSRAAYNSLESENQSYVDDCLDPWLVEWEEESDGKLLTEEEQTSEEVFHEFNRTARLRTDTAARGTFYQALRGIGVLSANDILRRENMPTIGADGDVRYVPANWMKVGSESQQSAQNRKLVRQTLANLLDTVLSKKADIEREKVLKAAEREADFTAWLVTFYGEHARHLIDVLEPAQRVAEAALAYSFGNRWNTLLIDFAGQRRMAIIAGLDDCGRELYAGRAEQVARGWSHARLIKDLLATKRRK